MSKADKKSRHKAKREAKRKESRRRQSVSPIRQLAEAKGELECWVSDGIEGFGQMEIFVFKKAAALAGVVCFLVDIGVVGLKDAWLRMRTDRTDLQDMIETSKRGGINMHRASIDEVRRWVGGGIRWARQNGMRLPKDWEKCVSILGGAFWESAEVSAFRKEFAGHPRDLRQRLISEPFETYIRRTDIDFVFDDDAPYLDPKTGDYVDSPDSFDDDEDDDGLDSFDDEFDFPPEMLKELKDRISPTATTLVAATTEWLEARGQSPSPELFEAWCTILIGATLSKVAMPQGSADEIADFNRDILDTMTKEVPESRLENFVMAFEQARSHSSVEPALLQKNLPPRVSSLEM